MISAALVHWNCPADQSRRFDAERAFGHLRRLVLMGPRVPGEPAHEQAERYISRHLEASGFHVIRQNFSRYAPLLNRTIRFTNIIGIANPGAPEKVLLTCHWDTRPIADRDPNAANRSRPIPGANDGASGVAVLLELASVLHDSPTSRCVCLVFFDGEDLGQGGRPDEFCYGSRHFAAEIPAACRPVRAAVNIDMVGDADLTLPREGFSVLHASDLTDAIWKIGTKRYPEHFLWNVGPAVYDDHMPLLEAGLSAVNIIDFNYPAWHTMDDDVARCSPRSLKIVGDVLLEWLGLPEPWERRGK
ncbi:MAG: M28 family peptidase [Candidatus Sumerlaeia bacterium]